MWHHPLLAQGGAVHLVPPRCPFGAELLRMEKDVPSLCTPPSNLLRHILGFFASALSQGYSPAPRCVVQCNQLVKFVQCRDGNLINQEHFIAYPTLNRLLNLHLYSVLSPFECTLNLSPWLGRCSGMMLRLLRRDREDFSVFLL